MIILKVNISILSLLINNDRLPKLEFRQEIDRVKTNNACRFLNSGNSSSNSTNSNSKNIFKYNDKAFNESFSESSYSNLNICNSSSLLIIDINTISLLNVKQLLKNIKYQIIFSNSLPQMLDFIQQYYSIDFRINKIQIFKNDKSDDDIIVMFCLELI